MTIRAILIAALTLPMQACAAPRVMCYGAEMSEALCAHQMSLNAVAGQSSEQSECQRTARTADNKELAMAICRIGGGNGQMQVPQFQAPPSVGEQALRWVGVLAPIGMGVAGLVVQDRANQRQTLANVELAGINAVREVGVIGAVVDGNVRIASGGLNAATTLGAAGIAGAVQIAQGSQNASQAQAAVWAQAMASLPPTTQITAGRDVIQARDVDQSLTLGHRVTGDGNEVARNVDCVSVGGAGAPGTATAASTASSSGTTSPLSSSYNALTPSGGDGAPATNNCGG